MEREEQREKEQKLGGGMIYNYKEGETKRWVTSAI